MILKDLTTPKSKKQGKVVIFTTRFSRCSSVALAHSQMRISRSRIQVSATPYATRFQSLVRFEIVQLLISCRVGVTPLF